MPRYIRKLAVLAKIEASYGADAEPTGGANAMQMTNVTLNPSVGEDVSRELLLPYMGHQGVILTGTHATLSGEVEIAGAGAAGDVPAYAPLLRASGFHQTVDEGVDVEFNPVSGSFEAASIYYNLDGVRHILLGARGTVSLRLAPRQIPRFAFNLAGLGGTISDTALPSVDLSDFVKPVPVSNANTTMSLHGWTAIAESLEIALGGQVEPRMLIGHESIEIVDRQAIATAVVEATSLATINWFARAHAETDGTLAVQHGTVAGNIVALAAPKVQIGRPTQGGTQGIANYSLPLMIKPDAGNDELIITVK